MLIAASSDAHAELIVAAAAAGKAVFCEKPMSMTLADADRALAAVERAGVVLQVGFNRRFDKGFRAAHDAVTSGAVGNVQLMRSLTRDPGLANPGGVPPWTIFTQTLIHDFDTLLWLNPGAEPVEVYATADALVAPDFKASGLLDTAVVVITFDNGARAVAEASFSAAVRLRRPRGGVRLGRHGHRRRRCPEQCPAVHGGRRPARHRPWRRRTDAGRLHGRVRRVRRGRRGEPVGVRHRPRRAPRARRRPGVHRLRAEPRTRTRSAPARWWRDDHAVHPGRLRRDGVHRPADPGPGPAHRRTRLPGRDLGLDQARHRRARPRAAPPSPR